MKLYSELKKSIQGEGRHFVLGRQFSAFPFHGQCRKTCGFIKKLVRGEGDERWETCWSGKCWSSRGVINACYPANPPQEGAWASRLPPSPPQLLLMFPRRSRWTQGNGKSSIYSGRRWNTPPVGCLWKKQRTKEPQLGASLAPVWKFYPQGRRWVSHGSPRLAGAESPGSP